MDNYNAENKKRIKEVVEELECEKQATCPRMAFKVGKDSERYKDVLKCLRNAVVCSTEEGEKRGYENHRKEGDARIADMFRKEKDRD